jgi:arginase family enzyme
MCAALATYGVSHPAGWAWPVVLDAGDITPAPGHDEAALRQTHERVTAAVAALMDAGLFPVGIGGGHDLTFPFVRAVARRETRPLSGVYFDAHLDVRETAGSGMAFRRLIEECGVRALHVHGLNPLANAREHVQWFTAHGGSVRAPGLSGLSPPSDMQSGTTAEDPFPSGPLFASFDLDVIDAAAAPGVSALNPAGWMPAQAEAWMLALGRRKELRALDIMELNPAFDEGGRTARLAAHLFLTFLRGFAERPA